MAVWAVCGDGCVCVWVREREDMCRCVNIEWGGRVWVWRKEFYCWKGPGAEGTVPSKKNVFGGGGGGGGGVCKEPNKKDAV